MNVVFIYLGISAAFAPVFYWLESFESPEINWPELKMIAFGSLVWPWFLYLIVKGLIQEYKVRK